jgi:hypothetical protein
MTAFKARHLIERRRRRTVLRISAYGPKTPPNAQPVLNRSTRIYLPPDFSKYDAVACGKLIDQAYAQFTAADNHNLTQLYRRLG